MSAPQPKQELEGNEPGALGRPEAVSTAWLRATSDSGAEGNEPSALARPEACLKAMSDSAKR